MPKGKLRIYIHHIVLKTAFRDIKMKNYKIDLMNFKLKFV